MSALTVEVRGLQATVTKFNNFNPSPKPNNITSNDAKPKPTGNVMPKLGLLKDDGKPIHWKWTPPVTRVEKMPKKEKSVKHIGGVRNVIYGT